LQFLGVGADIFKIKETSIEVAVGMFDIKVVIEILPLLRNN